LELVGEFTNQRILDLGCGDGTFGQEALTRGCQSYLGIEGSSNMVNSAQQVLAGTNGKVVHATVENWDYPAQAFDLVISRLVLHYIKDVDSVFRHVHQTLTNNGRFVFSIEHPVITSCDRGWQGNGLRQDWLVDNYFDIGKRITSWMGGQVIKYHRTVENYFVGLQRAGFGVESLREAEPQPERFKEDDDTYQRRKRIPLFLIMAGQKNSIKPRA
jgi:SAM-dependent methyltransferase